MVVTEVVTLLPRKYATIATIVTTLLAVHQAITFTITQVFVLVMQLARTAEIFKQLKIAVTSVIAAFIAEISHVTEVIIDLLLVPVQTGGAATSHAASRVIAALTIVEVFVTKAICKVKPKILPFT